MDRIYYWDADDTTKECIIEFLETADPFYFRYSNKDYLIERYETGYIIVDPFEYYDEGGYPSDTKFAYEHHLEAKTPDEFLKLKFLDGKTLFERWDEIRFFNY